MAQVPATPKPVRLQRLAQAALTGPESLVQRDQGLHPSERAALSLRGLPPRAPATEVIFLIPLVAKSHVGDWPGTCARLGDTLASFARQSDARWSAVICGQDLPGALPDDPRITFLSFTDPVEGNDKWVKLARLANHLPELGVSAGYAMTFDADDIAAPGLVGEVLTRQAAGGYLATTGYILDKGTDTLALAAPPSLLQPLRKPFWKLCGSCAALRFDLANGAGEIDFLREMIQHEHRMFPYLARLAGRRLAPLSEPRVLYLLNHGENFGARRGRISFKSRFVQRFAVRNDTAARTLFNL